MVNSPSACPICRKIIKDSDQDKCDQCYWLLNTENLLNSEICNSLIEWAIYHYQRADDLCRKDYDHIKLESRLNRQRDDIDRLQNTIDSFVNIPAIKSILLSEQIATNRSVNTSSIKEEDSIDGDNSSSISSNIQLNKTSQQEENSIQSTPTLTKVEQDIISEYYYNLSRFADKYHIKTVNVTKESLSANWGNEKKNVVFEEFNRGNYWVFNIEDNTYLVPANYIDIDRNTHTTTSTIFENHNYRHNYDKIQLIKPAIVKADPNTNPQTWRLQERGELVFL
ncbi:hypothetical protein [Chamaesiphon sp.]|uniref:hypothetical protein n=1 Tax=Chamaesiphon sp. TaxID=2814140 RepID=UPI0035941FBC